VRRAALIATIAFVVLAAGGAAADTFAVRLVSQTSSSITLGWDPQPGYGYLFSSDGVLRSRTNDPNRSSVTFSKVASGQYEVAVIVKGALGTYTSAPPPPPPPPPDTTPPNPPSGTLGPATQISVTLNWQPGVDNVGVHHYEVYRGTSSSASAQTKVTDTTALTYTLTGLTCGTSYSLGLTVVDAAGNKSSLAQAVWYPVRTLDCTTPPPPPPPPPSDGTLMWSPPALSNPQTINVTNSGQRYFELTAGQDYIVKLPSTPLGRYTGQAGYPALWLAGGRNVVIVGGEIKIDELAIPSLGSFNQRGIVFSGQTGTVHVEGVWIHGNGMAQAISFDNGRGQCGIAQIQNSRLETPHPVWHTNEGEPVEVHTDTLQSWCGPTTLRLFQDTLISTGNVLQFQPRKYISNHPLTGWDYRHVNFVNTTPESYALWKQFGPWAEYHEDLWLQTHPNHPWASQHSAWANDATCWPCWNPGGSWPITGEAFHIGLRSSDFVPVGVAGVGYVSPGYQ
jgi:hypothetical protein